MNRQDSNQAAQLQRLVRTWHVVCLSIVFFREQNSKGAEQVGLRLLFTYTKIKFSYDKVLRKAHIILIVSFKTKTCSFKFYVLVQFLTNIDLNLTGSKKSLEKVYCN